MENQKRLDKAIYSNVAACALQRWASYAGKTSYEDRRRANDEKQTALMALQFTR